MFANAAAAIPRHILVVDDDSELRQTMVEYLAGHGYAVHPAADGKAMAAILDAEPIDLIVLDIMLPGEDGLSICRRITDDGGPAIIMVSAMGEEIDRVLGLELGADDYLAKPCSPRELLARVRSLFRRIDETRGKGGRRGGLAYHFAGFSLDTVRRQLRAPNGAIILLTSGEFSLLSAFLEHPLRVLTRDALLEYARGGHSEAFDRAIDVQISRLRRKLQTGSGEEIIRTIRGAGYLFDSRVTRV